MRSLILAIMFGALFSHGSMAGDNTELKDLCPTLPEKVSSQRPKYNDFVSVKAGDKDWNSQYEKYTEAEKEFEKKFSNEISKVDLEWAKFEKKQFASQKQFYDLVSSGDSDDLLNETKSVCWNEIMKNDEFEKDNLCHTLEKPPTSKEWNKILLCTMERVNMLNIKLM